MATEKQIAANQKNAKSSTGPTSSGGLKRSSKNAIKHSLTARDVTIFGEAADRFEGLRNAYIEAWQPVGAIEYRLVEQMVIATWRLNRAHRIEAQIFLAETRAQHAEAKNAKPGTAADLLNAFDQSVDSALDTQASNVNAGSVFLKLSDCRDRVFPLLRYEVAAERSFYRALHNLERLQQRRLGNPVSAPMVIEADLQGDDS